MSNSSVVATVATICSISSTLPSLPKPYIERLHIINALDTMLEEEIQAVLLGGEEGIGKTTVATEFVLAHPDQAFSLFAVGPSALTRSPEFLIADLCDQISFAIAGKRPPTHPESRAF